MSLLLRCGCIIRSYGNIDAFGSNLPFKHLKIRQTFFTH